MEEMMTQVVLSAVASQALEKLKQTPYFPWINCHTKWLNTAVAAGLAAATAAGIQFSYNPDSASLVVTGITAANVAHFGWAWLQSFAIQHIVYKASVKRPAPTTQTNILVNNSPQP